MSTLVPMIGNYRQCEAVWPSAAHGGMWDAQCPNIATVQIDGHWYCPECAKEMS